jgi:hypothetical protein
MDLDHHHETLTAHLQQSISQTTEQTTLSDSFNPSRFLETLHGEDDGGSAAFPSIEGYLLGSFMPGVAGFSTPGCEGGFAQHSFGEVLQDWGFYQDRIGTYGPARAY